MNWMENLNDSINYIEEHLTKEIDLKEIAKIACCSTYQFQRMFSYIASIPLSEYIRRRRMTLAAVDLQNEKVLDVALKYGYDSPTSFNRAFQSIHGISPSKVKQEGMMIKAYPKISFSMAIKGDAEINYRIEKKEAFRVVGISKVFAYDYEENFKLIPKMWNEATKSGMIESLVGMMNTEQIGIMGVCVPIENKKVKYYIATKSSVELQEGYEEYEIPETTWAIFYGEGSMPLVIQELEKRIYSEWLPASGYEYVAGPDIELYLNPDPMNAKFEVWIPVKSSNE